MSLGRAFEWSCLTLQIILDFCMAIFIRAMLCPYTFRRTSVSCEMSRYKDEESNKTCLIEFYVVLFVYIRYWVRVLLDQDTFIVLHARKILINILIKYSISCQESEWGISANCNLFVYIQRAACMQCSFRCILYACQSPAFSRLAYEIEKCTFPA